MKKYLLFVTLSLLMLVSTNGIAAIQLSDCNVPVGSILIWPSQQMAKGYLPCDGRSYDTAEYEELFSVIGYAYTPTNKMDGSSFNVPDLRSMFVRGWDGGRGLDSGRPFGTNQEDAFQGHNHGGAFSGHSGGLKDNPRFFGYNASTNQGHSTGHDGFATFPNPGLDGSTDAGLGSGVPKISSETRPLNIAMNFVIRYASDTN